MKELVVDTSVLVAGLDKRDPHHQKARPIIRQLEVGEARFHLSTLVPVELYGALITPKRSGGKILRPPLLATEVSGIKESIDHWVKEGKIRLHALTAERMEQAATLAIRQKRKGPDAIVVQLAVELKFPLETYDSPMAKAWERERSRA